MVLLPGGKWGRAQSRPVALGQFGVWGGVVPRVSATFRNRGVSEQKRVLVAAPQVFTAGPGCRGGGGEGPGDVPVGRWRGRRFTHRPGLGGGEEESGVVGVLVQVGVGVPGLGRHCGGVQIRTGGQLG